MDLKINRLNKISTFSVPKENLLQNLIYIKENLDSTLTFRCGCKSGVCGSCAVRVNGVEKLACKTKINDNDLIEPIKNRKVIKDLVVDVSHETLLIKKTKSYINKTSSSEISNVDIKMIDRQSNCILCNSCYSSCPVYEVNEKFIGPFALTRALRYVNDKKNLDNNEIINSIQNDGVWDCTLCGACTLVCPQGIDPKMDIMQLQNISTQKGYSNPHMQSFDLNNFDMGFDPNSSF